MPIYKYTTLDDPFANGGIGTHAVGINNAGQIVGEYSDGSGIHGFLFSGGTYTTLNDPSTARVRSWETTFRAAGSS
jgi:probable HAF family extracellular repeat protein